MHKKILLLILISFYSLTFNISYATTIESENNFTTKENVFNVIDYPLTMVKSDIAIIADQAIANAQLSADLKVLYHSEDIKPQVDKLLIGVLKTLEDSDDLTLKASQIAKDTPLSLEDAHVLVKYTDKFDIPNSLVLALIETESDFDKYMVSSANDRGYMQIIPSTERWLANEYGENINLSYDPNRIFETEYQFGLGTSYLKVLFDKHGENIHKVLSEYNRGPSNLKAYYNKYGTYQTSYSKKVAQRVDKYAYLN